MFEKNKGGDGTSKTPAPRTVGRLKVSRAAAAKGPPSPGGAIRKIVAERNRAKAGTAATGTPAAAAAAAAAAGSAPTSADATTPAAPAASSAAARPKSTRVADMIAKRKADAAKKTAAPATAARPKSTGLADMFAKR